jgi:glycosyltransferase involved in cell wall biosynthesis
VEAFTVVIPVYDEAETVQHATQALDRSLANYPQDQVYEIIAIDDGSTDGSGDILQGLTGEIKDLTVIRHARNRGYGAALKTGICQAKYDIIAITDADGTYPPEFLAHILAHIDEGADMAVGARTAPNAHIPLIRRPAKWFIRKLASHMTNTCIPDLNSGLRAMRKAVIFDCWRLLPDGFSFTTTITLAMLSNSYRVDYIPIDYYARGGKSKIKPIRDTINFVQLILRTIMYFAPLKIFLPFGSTIIAIAVLVGTLSRLVTGQVMDVVSIVLFFTGVQILIAGMLADFIDKRTYPGISQSHHAPKEER